MAKSKGSTGSNGSGKKTRMAAYGKTRAASRGNSMTALSSRNNGSNTPF